MNKFYKTLCSAMIFALCFSLAPASALETPAEPEQEETTSTQDVFEVADAAEDPEETEFSVTETLVEEPAYNSEDNSEDNSEEHELILQAFSDAATDANAQEIPEAILGHPFLQGVSTLDIGDNRFSEVEPNNSMALADRIYNDYTVSGTLSSTDLLDFYCFTLSTTSEVQIISVASRKSFMFGIFDTSDECIAAGIDLGSSSSGTYGDGVTCTLPAGTYYVVTLDEYQYSNTYMFYIEITPTTTSHTHNYSAVVTPPTCENPGYTTYTCSGCGDSYVADETEATGHSWSDWIDVGNGQKQRTCSACSAVETESTEVVYILGDVNGDKVVDFNDAILILKYDAFISVDYPIGQPIDF